MCGLARVCCRVVTIADVAVKITPTSVVRSACKEVTALTRLNNAHIVQLLGVQVDMAKERVYMVMELCHGGELFDRIAECGGLVENEARRYFVQIVHALAHCHEKHVYHRDLKPENILLDAEDNAKVADFGLAAVYRHVSGGAGYLQHTKVGSVMYAAPEVLVSTATSGYDASCADTWSLGVILFSMLSGTLPFTCAAASKCKRYAAVMRHGISVMCPEHLSPQVTTLLSQLLHPDPGQRITPMQALQSEWVLGGAVDWPSHLLGLNRRADDSGVRSWTITMAVPTHHLHALPSVGASPAEQQRSQPPPQQQQQQQQQPPPSGGAPPPAGAGTGTGAASGALAGVAAEATEAMVTDSTPSAPSSVGAASSATDALPPQRGSPCTPRGPYSSSSGSCASGSGSGCGAAAPGGASSAANLLASPAKRKREADPGGTAAAAAGDASASAECAGDSGTPSLNALPLCGCVSEYIERWGWGTLPQGTEQMLRDILQTLCARAQPRTQPATARPRTPAQMAARPHARKRSPSPTASAHARTRKDLYGVACLPRCETAPPPPTRPSALPDTKASFFFGLARAPRQSMGLRYRLEEYSSLSPSGPGLLPTDATADGGAVLQAGTVGGSMQPPPPARTTHRLALNILF